MSEPGYEQNIPCPFCGSPPTIDHSGSTDFVWCSNPICWMHKHEGSMLLESWNQRAKPEPTPLTEEEKREAAVLMASQMPETVVMGDGTPLLLAGLTKMNFANVALSALLENYEVRRR